MKKLFQEKKILNLIVICLFAYGLVSVFMGMYRGIIRSKDFQWDSAMALAMRINPYEESLNPTGIAEKYGWYSLYGRLEANQFPSLLWLLYPLTFFKPQTANCIWAFCNLVFGAVFLYGLRKSFLKDLTGDEFLFFVAVFLSGTPLRNCLAMGQHTLFSLAFLMLSIILAQKGKWLWAGLLLSISWFKYALIIPIALYYIYKRWFKELIVSVVPHLLLTVFSAWWLDCSFIDMILQPLQVSAKLTDQGAIDLGVWIGNGSLTLLLEAAIGLCLVAFVFFIPKGYDKQVVTLLMLVSLIITYHRFYDFVVLAVPMALILFDKESTKIEKICITASVVISYYVFTVFIHIWGMEGIQYETLTVILALFYYVLLFVELKKNIALFITERRNKVKAGE